MRRPQCSALNLRLAGAAAFGVALVLALNLAVPTLLNFYWWSPDFSRWDRYIAYILRLHREVVGPFTRRPVTMAVIDGANQLLHSAWLSFLIVQGLLLGAAAYLVGLIAQRESGRESGLPTLLVFFGSFTVLFSFVTPNDSFDEPSQYLFALLALLALRGGRPMLFAWGLFLACLSRETSLFLLPGLWLLDPEKNLARRWRKFAAPLLAYAAFYLSRQDAGDPNRFLYWARNLASLRLAGESLVSYALALALPVGLVSAAGSLPREWARAFTLTALLNTPVVFFAAYARESRLFALPLLFLWPFAGAALKQLEQELRTGARRFRPAVALAALLASAALWLSYHPQYRHVLGYRFYAALLPWLLALGWIWPRRQTVENRPVPMAQRELRP